MLYIIFLDALTLVWRSKGNKQVDKNVAKEKSFDSSSTRKHNLALRSLLCLYSKIYLFRVRYLFTKRDHCCLFSYLLVLFRGPIVFILLWHLEELLVTLSGACELSAPAWCKKPLHLLHNWGMFQSSLSSGIMFVFSSLTEPGGLTIAITAATRYL
jgi:hypothetical protein